VSGSEESFRSQLNMQEGFLLEDLSLSFDGDGGVEEFTLDAWGFGDAYASDIAKVNLRFSGGFGLSLDYDRRESFFRLAESDLAPRTDDWEISRWRGALTIDSWRPIKIEVIGRWYERTGTSVRPIYGLNNLYAVGIDLDESMTEAALRLTTRTLPVKISFEQSWSQYERRNRRSPANDGQVIEGVDPDLLADTQTNFTDEIEVPTSRLGLSYSGARFEGVATVLYSKSDLDGEGTGFNTFAVGGGEIGTITYLDDLVGSAQMENLVGRINLGFLLSDRWVVRVAGDYRDATSDTALLGTRLLRSASPLGGGIELTAPINTTGRYGFKTSRARGQLEYRQNTWSLWGGGFTSSRDVTWQRTTNDDQYDVTRDSDGLFVGGSLTLDRLTGSIEYTKDDFTSYVFRTDPETVDRLVVKLRARLGGGWQLTADGRFESADNPAQISALDHSSDGYGAGIAWAGENGTSAAGLRLDAVTLRTLTGLVLPDDSTGLSDYDLDLTTASLYGQTTIGAVGLYGAATWVTDNGTTWPLSSWNAEGRVTFRGPGGLDYGVFAQFWSYDEDLADLDDYDVTRYGLSLSWRFE
jgi:hypothetical protein